MTSSTSFFFQKMHSCIHDVVNPNDYKNLRDLTKQCNEVLENKAVSSIASASAAAATVQHAFSPARGSRRSSLPFRLKQSARAKSSPRRWSTLAPARGSQDGDCLCFYHARFQSRARKCKAGCTYQENE